MTFGAIGFLFAAFAAVVPVILHMISRQRAKELPFSTLRFLRISVEKTRRRRRIQDVLLMLLRMAVLILIALGLAKPTLTNLSSLLGGADSAVAIILDNSASMGMIDQNRMRLETAVDAARQIMEQLGDGDSVALYVCGGPNLPEEGKLDRTHEKVSQILDQLVSRRAVSYERADLAGRVHDARNLLLESDAPNKQIFVISDLQALSWEGLKDASGPDAGRDAEESLGDEDREKEQIPLILVDCHRTPKPNVAIMDVDLQAVLPVANVPVKATAELFNTAPVPRQPRLELYVDGAKEASSPVLTLSPGERQKHDFQFKFKRGGLHRGEVRLVADEDGSRLDDRWFFTMEVDQGIPLAVVSDRRHEIDYLDDAFYVKQALAPGTTGAWAIRTTSLTAAELPTERLSQYTVILCVNLPAPDPDAAERLRSYVTGGGNLIWICGDNVRPEAYNRMNEEAQRQLLPAPLLEVRTPQAAGDRDSWHIGFLDKEHRALRHLVEPASLYQSVLVYRHVPMDAGAAKEAWVMARLDDGEPLLMRRRVEDGTVTMLGTSAHVGWTNLPVRTVFLPLLVQLAFDLAGAEQVRHQALAGSPIVVPFEDEIRPRAVEILPPSGATIRLRLDDDGPAGSPSFRYADTHDVGIYTLRLLEAVRPTQLVYSVNVDPDEADPTTIARGELEQRFGRTPLVFADDPEDLSSTFDYLREGESLWELFLAAVLIGLVFETFVSNWFSPKQEQDELRHVAPGMRRLARKGRSAA